MPLVRSLLFASIFYPGTVLYILACFAVMPFGPGPLRAAVIAWTRFHRRCAAWLLGIRTRVEGSPPSGPVLVASKHQSMFETLELAIVLHSPVLVMKRELADIPFWGRLATSYGMIPVDRAAGAKALRSMLKEAAAARREGRPVVIFPEGTRVAPGEQPELQPGFAGLYRALGLPVVPVALDSGRLWPRGRLVKRPGIVTMRFGEPIPPGLPREEIEARVHEAINLLDRG
jgi:1-acyl-sn-glycerol-3-phosphate acyltransferase